MANQSIKDRLFRLSEGRCPVHGHYLSQKDSFYEPESRCQTCGHEEYKQIDILGCPRKTCNIKIYDIDGKLYLSNEFKYLLERTLYLVHG